ncbi:hypothetical protein BGZ94_005802 [Podila epigama]|nr:hypothetical protein BGZ94_005802 [Podila epigama]
MATDTMDAMDAMDAMDPMDRFDEKSLLSQSSIPLDSQTRSPLQILEILERILYLVPPQQLDSIRLVSHIFNQASFRPRWRYPNLACRGMSQFGPKLRKYGHVVHELDFTASYMYSRDPLEDVKFLIRYCPNVRSLAMTHGCFTFMGVEQLIHHYANQKLLHTLKLDMTRNYMEPSMEVITQIKTLRSLSLYFNRTTRHPMAFDYEELFTSCPLLQDLTLIPAPHFRPTPTNGVHQAGYIPAPPVQPTSTSLLFSAVLDQIAAQSSPPASTRQKRLTTEETLKTFEEHRPKLRRLHLEGVYFRDKDIQHLASACPDIEDLRLTCSGMAELSRRDASTPSMAGVRSSFTLQAVVESWPRIKKLQVDGTLFETLPSGQVGTPVGIEASSSSSSPMTEIVSSERTLSTTTSDSTPATIVSKTTGVPHLSPPVGTVFDNCMISSFSIRGSQTLSNEILIAIVDRISPTLHYLNVDHCQKLDDIGIRHVFMTCSSLIGFSAVELNLTMALFEDVEPIDLEIMDMTWKSQSLGLSGHSDSAAATRKVQEPLQAKDTSENNSNDETAQQIFTPEPIKKKWACAKTLRVLDLSWRHMDGRPKFIPADYGKKELQDACRLSKKLWSNPDMRELLIVPESVPRSYRPMFRKRWLRSSIYRRLAHLERIEALLLQGWSIPWHTLDMMDSFAETQAKIDALSLCSSSRSFEQSMQRWTRDPIETTANRLVVGYERTGKVFQVTAWPLDWIGNQKTSSVTTTTRAAAQVQVLPWLRYLNIRCNKQVFYSHPDQLFLHNGTADSSTPLLFSKLRSTTPSTRSWSSLVSTPADNVLSSSSSSSSPSSSSSLLADSQSLAESSSNLYALLGMLVRLCPRLETIGLQPPGATKFTSWLGAHLFYIQLAVAKDSDAEGGNVNMNHLPSPDTPLPSNLSVSSRRVLCTPVEMPEYFVIPSQ